MHRRVISRRNIAHYKGELKDICKTILRGKLKQGPCIRQFEEEFAKYTGTKYAIAVASGRLGLFLILQSLSLDKKAQVILPAYTDESVPMIIEKSGCEPVFIDIDKRSHNINLGLIEKKINHKSKVIIATHLFGRPCNLTKILTIAREYNLVVIEDCAHAIGTEYNFQKVGSFGRAAYFSFGLTKPLNTFGGGMITTNDTDLYSEIKKRIENYHYPNNPNIIKNIFLSYSLYFVTRPFLFSIAIFPILLFLSLFNRDLINTYNKTAKKAINLGDSKVQYTNLQSLVGLKQLKNFDALNERRIFNSTLLSKFLDRQIPILKDDENSKTVYYFYVVLDKNINILSRKLLFKGIDTGKHLMRNCSAIYANNDDCPFTNEAFRTSLQIPVYPQLEERDIRYIASVLNQALKQSLEKPVV